MDVFPRRIMICIDFTKVEKINVFLKPNAHTKSYLNLPSFDYTSTCRIYNMLSEQYKSLSIACE